jgi:hypothetical protein
MNINPSRFVGGHIPKEITLERSPRLITWRCMDAWCMFSHLKLKGTSWKVAIRNACSLGIMLNPRFINVLTWKLRKFSSPKMWYLTSQYLVYQTYKSTKH